jgi:hypothetical protein
MPKFDSSLKINPQNKTKQNKTKKLHSLFVLSYLWTRPAVLFDFILSDLNMILPRESSEIPSQFYTLLSPNIMVS